MALSQQPIPIADLLLPPLLHTKLAVFGDTARLRMMRPETLRSEWNMTQGQWERVNRALASRGQEGLGEYVVPEKVAVAASLKGKCRKVVEPERIEDGLRVDGVACGRPLLEGHRSCQWHWLATQPIELQTEWADRRRAMIERSSIGPFAPRARVPEAEWPEGTRFCSECQTFVPLFYTRGSRCVAHASRAAHASRIKGTYDFTREDYEALLTWQKGRCYICRQVPRTKRLAVDHDHETGEVRGLLCANDEWGCNATLARLLNDKAMAQRALDYVTQSPMKRMLAGQPKADTLDPFKDF